MMRITHSVKILNFHLSVESWNPLKMFPNVNWEQIPQGFQELFWENHVGS